MSHHRLPLDGSARHVDVPTCKKASRCRRWRSRLTFLLVVALLGGCQSDEVTRDGGSGGEVSQSGDVADTETDPADTSVAPDDDGHNGPEAGQPDTDGRDSGDAGEGDVDATPPDADCPSPVDSDADGLTDCQERRLCTDPEDGDTDGDYLSDFEELQRHQTDPCSRDTDGDGVGDKKEVEVGLDPNRRSTYNDGTLDANRWVVDACSRHGPEPVALHANGPGNWRLALDTGFSHYTNLTIPTASRPVAAAVFGDTTREVAGALLSTNPSGGQASVTETLNNDVRPIIRQLGGVTHNFADPQFRTHDGKPAVHIEYEIETATAKSVRRMRDDVLFALAPFGGGDVRGRPSTAGASFRSFRVEVTLISRTATTGSSYLYAVAIAPLTAHGSQPAVRAHLDDIVNTTNIADAVDTTRVGCRRMGPPEKRRSVDFYFVLDDSPSGNDDSRRVRTLAASLISHLNTTTLDFRLGVTNLDARNAGRLFVPPGWHTGVSTFRSEIRNRVTVCQTTSNWYCAGAVHESPLHNAMMGLKYMKGLTSRQPGPNERIRPDASVYTITTVDEDPQGPKRQMAMSFLPNHTRAFFLVPLTETIEPGPPKRTTCGPTPNFRRRPYENVARASGGSLVDGCSADVEQTLKSIFNQAAGRLSHYRLPETPISSSLRVYLNGRWVPRSRTDGFDYFPGRNSLAFFGDYRPEILQEDGRPEDIVAIHYETFVERCKTTGDANSCR